MGKKLFKYSNHMSDPENICENICQTYAKTYIKTYAKTYIKTYTKTYVKHMPDPEECQKSSIG